MQKKSLLIVIAVYLVSSLTAYGLTALISQKNKPLPAQLAQDTEEVDQDGFLLEIDPAEPKDQACPLNGKLFTKTERDAWEKRRPIAVMIENTPDARPQSGLSDADVVFEAVAESGITRFMAFFYCGAQAQDVTVAPVRSARQYYLDYASGFNLPLYVHVGGSNVPGEYTDALGSIREYGWSGENDLNQFSIGYPTFVRDYNRIPGKEIATEHTMVSSTEKLWAVGEERGWTNMSPDSTYRGKTVPGTDWKEGYEGWPIETEPSDSGSIKTIAYEFWEGYDQYAVKWQYDAVEDMFLRNQGGEKHLDLNNDEQVKASTVIVLLTTEKGPVNEKKHMIYGTTGTGDALIFKHGAVIKGSWEKEDRESELVFLDEDDDPVEMAPGLIWISVINKNNDVIYE